MDPESPCSDHSSTGAITCALCRARGINCLKSKHCISFAIVAFKLAIAWSASFVSYPARLDPACWGLRVGMKRLDPVHGLAVEEEFLNMESMKTLRSKTLRKPLHILKSNANQPIEKMKEKTFGRKRLQPSMKTVAWPCPDSFFFDPCTDSWSWPYIGLIIMQPHTWKTCQIQDMIVRTRAWLYSAYNINCDDAL